MFDTYLHVLYVKCVEADFAVSKALVSIEMGGRNPNWYRRQQEGVRNKEHTTLGILGRWGCPYVSINGVPQ